ncbi:glycosyl hydrolase family 18 protein [Bradyrhizobium sp. Cp5.3]|uniref:glycosyl hydrolase family 18 protein n=1 Tax=Bradyrhizobium sp. Cp5.3 TaxID=443598 RepID=UPI0004818C2A|nr:glycosyl hydrolase family 18 protein [Bradyrhizobium sp. Cp5.3]
MIARTILRQALLSIIFAFCSWANALAAPEISAYFLSGPPAEKGSPAYYASLMNLKELSNKIGREGANFNNLMLSFVHPSLIRYTPNDLSCTGLFGYTCTDGKAVSPEPGDPKADFDTLKKIVAELKANGVATYIAVGGWNFSCLPKIYDKTTAKPNSCGPQNEVYDTFPNPATKILRPSFESRITGSNADDAYKNIVSLANDLGVAGIDVDYEEFWHADINAKSWTLTPDKITPPGPDEFKAKLLSDTALMERGMGEDVFDDSMKLNPDSKTTPRAMPRTIEKFAAILKSLDTSIKSIKPSLKLSAAAPATGGIPIMSANWGTVAPNSGIDGGAWWGGNLYGLIYNTALLHQAEIDKLSHIGVMSYDLSDASCESAHPDSHIPCDLVGQVNFYYNQFVVWLKSGSGLPADSKFTSSNALVSGSRTRALASLQPRKLLIAPPITVGFEVGQPATGNLPLTKRDLAEILDETVKYSQSGIIVWDLYKDVRSDEHNWNSSWATPKDVLKEACTKMGLSGLIYNCAANIPR